MPITTPPTKDWAGSLFGGEFVTIKLVRVPLMLLLRQHKFTLTENHLHRSLLMMRMFQAGQGTVAYEILEANEVY